MARTRVRITRWNPRPFLSMLDGALAARMETAAGLVEGRVKGSMVGGGRPHVPSAPGEPPHIDTGHLRRNISHQVVVERGHVRGFVISNAAYSRALELGYPPGNLAARPYMRPVINDHRTRADIYRILTGSGRALGSHITLGEIRGMTAPGGFSAGLDVGGA